MIVFGVFKLEKLNTPLSENITCHCKQKYSGEMLSNSLFAYQSLALLYKEKTGRDLPKITFLDNGKPVSEDISVTLSHSEGAVAVGFSTDKNINIGVDIELIKAKKPQVVKLLGLDENCTDTDFYLAWTKNETLKKALNLSLLKDNLSAFVGESKVVKINGKNYAVSIYSEGDYESNI